MGIAVPAFLRAPCVVAGPAGCHAKIALMGGSEHCGAHGGTTLLAGPGARAPGANLVWNKGIAALCDWRMPDEFAVAPGYTPVPLLAGASPGWRTPRNLIRDPSVYAGVEEGAVIWLRLAWIKSFVRQVLPRIRARFVLVTADSDTPVPGGVRRLARTLVNDQRLIHWYAQNYDGSDHRGRISPLPIGIDFHTLAERPFWGEQVAPPAEQERTLLSIRDGLPPLSQRIPAVYVDFGWQRTHLGGRRSLIRHLRGQPDVVLQQAPLPRAEMWRRRGRYAFVLSPPGNGLDTHRIWEALALGHIALTPESALDPLFQGLRVACFRHWSELRRGSLHHWLAQHGRAPVGVEDRLTSAYWISKIRSGQPV